MFTGESKAMRSVCLLPVLVALALLLAGVSTVSLAMPAADYALSTTDGLTLSISSDGQVTGLQIDGHELVTTPAPAFSIRDLSDAAAVISPNLIPNAGFEDGLTGWSELTNNGLDVSIVISPTHNGGLALALANLATDTYAFAAYASDPVPVTPGQRYRFSAWFRSATGYVTSPSGPPTLWQMTLWRELKHTNGLYVQWLDAVGQPLGDPQLAVALHWNAGRWRILRRELTAPSGAQQATAIVAAKLRDQTLWVDDLALVPAPEPDVEVLGSVAPCVTAARESQTAALENAPAAHGVSSASGSSCLVHTATLANGLAVTMTYTAHADHIVVHGEIVDATGQDRALDLTWGVPVDVTDGWRWWDDAHTWRPITGTGTYAHAISAIYDGWLPISLYPYAGIAGPSAGLALGLPLDRPQLALLSYDGAAGRYGATFHLGISPQAVKVGPRAAFDLLMFRSNPAWGFRDTIARHRALQPEAYTTTLPVYDYDGAEQGWFFTQAGVQQALADDAANIYSAQYTVGELPLKVAASSDPRPTLDQALAVVTNTLSSPRPWEAELARAITQSAVVDPNEDWSLKHIGVYSWATDWWEAAWAANLDPDLADGLGSWNLEWRITPAFTATTEAGAHLDGVQIDNFMSTPTFDLRPQALAVADWPLAYTPHTYQPAVHDGFAFREYLAFLRDYLDAEWGTDKGISVNFWGLGHPNYLAEYIDVFGGEGNLTGNGEGPNWNPEILDYRRAIAFGRPYLFTNQTVGLTAGEAHTGTRLAILYGVRSGHGPNGQGWEPAADQIVSDTAELVSRYWAAGWEPLTYARSDRDDAWIERFGAPTAGHGPQAVGGDLYFAVHNHSDLTHTVTITIETIPLGLTGPTTAVITDVAVTQTVPFTTAGGDIVVSLSLGPRDSRVLQVSGGVAISTPLYVPALVADWGYPMATIRRAPDLCPLATGTKPPAQLP